MLSKLSFFTLIIVAYFSFVIARSLFASTLGLWQSTSSLVELHGYTAAVTVGGYVYVIGGEDCTLNCIRNTVERAKINLDGSLSSWQIESQMIKRRVGHTAVAFNNYIYVLSGQFDATVPGSVERTQINPDGSLSLWGFVSSMLEVRFAHAAIQHDENLYALGGNDFAGSDLRTTERATQLTPTPTPSPSPLPSPSPTPSPSPFPSPTPTPTITVNIDIKPGSYPNSINPKSNGKIPVAILSTNSFNATTQINRTSLIFGRTGDEPSMAFCGKTGEDVNADGLLDLVCHFTTKLTGFQNGNTLGKLKGKTVGGIPISGDDSIRLVI